VVSGHSEVRGSDAFKRRKHVGNDGHAPLWSQGKLPLANRHGLGNLAAESRQGGELCSPPSKAHAALL
jgi:hypothetical protein